MAYLFNFGADLFEGKVVSQDDHGYEIDESGQVVSDELRA